MAIVTTPTPEGEHAEPTKEQARQGQNIQGMVTVLAVSILLVVIAYAAMLALFGGGEKSDNSPKADIVSESSASVPATPAPSTPLQPVQQQ